MNRKIKFRGRTFDDKTVYGFYLYEKNIDCHYIIDEDGEEFIVKPDSIAQMIELDATGKEIYEGDKLKYYDETDCDDCLTADFRYLENILEGILIKAEA